MKIKSFFGTIYHWIWTIFLQGLLTILPMTITIALILFSIRLLANWLDPLHSLVEKTPLGALPYSEIVLAIAIIFAIGTIMKIFILRSIVHGLESLVFRLPLIRPVYSGIKQLVHALSVQDKFTFKQVVIIEFPREKIYSLGFLTSELPDELSPETGVQYFNVFVPTTPNPTSGYFVIVPKGEIHVIDLTRQEAMAMIISGGIIKPERFM